MHDLMEQSESLPTYVIGSDEKYYADLSRPVNIPKYYDVLNTISELESFRNVSYPDSIVSSHEGPTLFGLPLPSISTGAYGGAVVDYTSYVMTHLREWSATFLIEDKVLDKI